MSNSKAIMWSAWLIASIFYAYQYILRVMPNIMLKDIMKQFNIDTALFGQFSGSYYLGYCLMHLPIGIMLDRYGPKKVISSCILLTVIGLLPIIFSTHWAYPVMGRFVIGIGSSAAILGTFKTIRIAFNEKHFSRMLSFSVTIGLLGAIYGGAPVSYLFNEYGFKSVVKIIAGFGIALSLISYLIIPDIKSENKSTVLSDLKSVITNDKVIIISLLAGLLVGPLEGFADAFGSEFLKQIYNIDSIKANYLITMMYIGMCFAPMLSYIAEKTNKYLETIAGAGFFMSLVFILLVMGKLNTQIIGVSFFLVGVCCAYQILAIYKASTYVLENISGLTTAITNMIIMSFGYVFHSSIGLLIKHYDYKGEKLSFIYGVSFVPIMLILGTFGFYIFLRKEKKLNN